MKNKIPLLVLLITIFSAFFYLYNLIWGSPFHFNPDERNIVGSVVQLKFPNQMNPNFFAYGSLPIYCIFFLGSFLNFLLNIKFDFSYGIFLSRFYSAIFAILLIPSGFIIGRYLKNNLTGFLFCLLSATSVGFLQFSHFGTFEMWTTFFSFWLFYFCLKIVREKKFSHILLASIISGLLISIKISNLIYIPLVVFSLFLENKWSKLPIKISLCILIAALVFFLTSPFFFIENSSALSTLKYESSVATGLLPVFYTGGFYNTIPVFYQFTKVFPFIINPLNTILLSFAFLFVCYEFLKQKRKEDLIFLSFFLIIFLSQAVLFVKWTRYLIPLLPFAYLMIAILFEKLITINKNKRPFSYFVVAFFLIFNLVFSLSYFITVLSKQDSRIAGADWAKINIPPQSNIISEVYDLGIIPFNYLSKIKLFHFYDYDVLIEEKETELTKLINESEYIILPSQRILKSRLINKDKFPKGFSFYSKLLNGSLGFKKIYQTPCDFFCRIIYLNNPIFSFEETANVFDRPTIMIFKKTK